MRYFLFTMIMLLATLPTAAGFPAQVADGALYTHANGQTYRWSAAVNAWIRYSTDSQAMVAAATQHQAEAGVDNDSYMTPLRTMQAVDKVMHTLRQTPTGMFANSFSVGLRGDWHNSTTITNIVAPPGFDIPAHIKVGASVVGPGIAANTTINYITSETEIVLSKPTTGGQHTGAEFILGFIAGHVILESGLILQWGHDLNGLTTGTVTFPVEFSTMPLQVMLSAQDQYGIFSTAYYGRMHVTDLNRSGFTWTQRSPTSRSCYWMAIGF